MNGADGYGPWSGEVAQLELKLTELTERLAVVESRVDLAVSSYVTKQAMRDAVALLTDVMTGHADPEDACYNECDHEMCGWCRDAMKVIFTLDAATGEKK